MQKACVRVVKADIIQNSARTVCLRNEDFKIIVFKYHGKDDWLTHSLQRMGCSLIKIDLHHTKKNKCM